MEKKYYGINEKAAETAKRMMSFSDYVHGSKTEEYQCAVDAVWELAEKVAEEHPEEAERVYFLADRYAKKLADNMNKDFAIAARCPSIMIAGGSNFPVRKKEKQVAAWERNNEEYRKIQEIPNKIRAIRNGKGIVKAGDPCAIEKLEAKIEDAKALQEKMKAANKALRIKDTEAGNEELRELGFTDDRISELRTGDFCGRIGFPSYMLQNNNAEIHRLERRLKDITAVKEAGDSEEDCGVCTLIRDTGDMRIRLVFDDKPEAKVRDILKSHGFKWSPKNKAWQRMLNAKGELCAKWAIEELKELDA